MSQLAVHFKQVLKLYRQILPKRKIIALDRIDLKIPQGKIFGILGPNGSGKSTCLKLMLGLMLPNKGEIKIYDLDPRSLQVKKRIGYLPEETALYSFLNAREMLTFYGKISGSAQNNIKKRVEEVLHTVGLHDAANRSAKQYSKGMLRRLGLGLVLLKDPDLYVLDEPTIGLDPLAVRDFKELILDLRKKGRTIILSSHLLAEIENVCDEVAILYKGTVLKIGSIDKMLEIKDQVRCIIAHKNIEDVRGSLNRSALNILEIGYPRKSLEEAFIDILQTDSKP